MYYSTCIPMTYSTPNSFSIINNISTLVNTSNSNAVFFKQACHANTCAGKNEQDHEQFIYFNTHVSKILKYICKQQGITLNLQIVVFS